MDADRRVRLEREGAESRVELADGSMNCNGIEMGFQLSVAFPMNSNRGVEGTSAARKHRDKLYAPELNVKLGQQYIAHKYECHQPDNNFPKPDPFF